MGSIPASQTRVGEVLTLYVYSVIIAVVGTRRSRVMVSHNPAKIATRKGHGGSNPLSSAGEQSINRVVVHTGPTALQTEGCLSSVW